MQKLSIQMGTDTISRDGRKQIHTQLNNLPDDAGNLYDNADWAGQKIMQDSAQTFSFQIGSGISTDA